MTNAPSHFSALARRSGEPPISWLMHLKLDRPDLISLAAGFTDNATLPVDEVQQITRRVLARPATARPALQYGTTLGSPPLRQQLLKRWQQQDGVNRRQAAVSADDLIVTNGSQQLLYLVSEALCDPGDVVLMEDPTYFVYLGIVEALGIQPRGFWGIDALKQKLELLRRQRLLARLKFLYLVTYHQNPTGHTWSLEDRHETMAVVRHYEKLAGHPLYLVDDAAYRDLRFSGEDVASFKTLDPQNRRVIYTSTLTKPFASGFKIGYGILPPAVMQAVRRGKGNHDFGSANFPQVILERALAEGLYDRHREVIARGYRRKRDIMMGALRGTPYRYAVPAGGLYIWLELPVKTRTGLRSQLFKRALDAGVLYVPGEMCYCHDPARPIPRHQIRLSYGAATASQIEEGMKLLLGVI